MGISIGQLIIDGNSEQTLYLEDIPIKSLAVYSIPGIKLYLSTNKKMGEFPIVISGLGLFQVEGLTKDKGTVIYRIDTDKESLDLLKKSKTKLYIDYLLEVS